ncbi:MAG: GHKL domain-containing protein [Burkholderiales bacterium]|nr:GHKL domain-containing protein [Burkholderiales bacterium]
MTDPANPVDPRDLEAAFSIFNAASEQLATAYQELQGRVEHLAAELAVANGELKQQYLDKEALSQRLELLLDALPGGVVVLDAAGSVMQSNPAARALLGAHLVGQPWSALAKSRLQPSAVPREWTVAVGADVRRVTLSESALDAVGARILLLHDVTEAARLQAQLEHHKKLSAMGEMAAGLAHQLRTPLATALLHAANLSRPGLKDADRERFSNRIRERLLHLEHMIQDMLLFVRGQAAEREVFPLADLLQNAVHTIEPQMQERGVGFESEGAAGERWLSGSRKALGAALLNLLENALAACESGGRVRLVATAGASDVLIRVVDTGCGIDPAVRDRLFEPFFTTRQEGTGLGLAIVRSVVEAHGGEVTVESEPGQGSVFALRLPLHNVEAVATA